MNLFICLHLDTSSSRVLSSVSGSAFMMVNFSVKHKSHFLPPHTYEWALEAMHHFKLCWILLYFNSQIYLESSVLFSLFLFLKDTMWFIFIFISKRNWHNRMQLSPKNRMSIGQGVFIWISSVHHFSWPARH